MNPQISLFPSRRFYGGKLGDAPNIAKDRVIEWHSKFPAFQFFTTSGGGGEVRNKLQSLSNMEEVRACAGLVRAFAENYPGINFGHRIGIITFYKDQVRKLRSEFRYLYGQSILDFIDINTVFI